MYLLMVMMILLSSTTWAATRPPPEDIPEGNFTTVPRTVTLSRDRAALVIVPDFLPHGATLDYMWQRSTDGGVTWRDWTGGSITGGVKRNRAGTIITEYQTITPPPTRGSVQVRMRGVVRGQPIRIAPDVEERD